MPIKIETTRRKNNKKTKRLKYLPRIGICFEFGDKVVTYKQAPFLETIVNVLERGVSLVNVLKVTNEQLDEIDFPKEKKAETVSTSAETISARTIKK